MANEATRLGAQLAAEPPAWAAALGPVPSDPARQEQWRQLAVEISTYRDTYRVPVSETSPVPAQHEENGTGAELTARIMAMHKYSAQTAKEPLAPVDAAHVADAAQVEALVKEALTRAEHVVDHLQETRGAEAQLSPAWERAERIAALARKVRENRSKAGHTTEDRPESVTEALEDIAARRRSEEADKTAAAQPPGTFVERLAASRATTAGKDGSSAVERLRRERAEQAAAEEEQRRREQDGPPPGGPSSGHRGPRL